MRRTAIALLIAASALSAVPAFAQDSSPQTRSTEKAIDTNVSQSLQRTQAQKKADAKAKAAKKKQAEAQAAQEAQQPTQAPQPR